MAGQSATVTNYRRASPAVPVAIPAGAGCSKKSAGNCTSFGTPVARRPVTAKSAREEAPSTVLISRTKAAPARPKPVLVSALGAMKGDAASPALVLDKKDKKTRRGKKKAARAAKVNEPLPEESSVPLVRTGIKTDNMEVISDEADYGMTEISLSEDDI